MLQTVLQKAANESHNKCRGYQDYDILGCDFKKFGSNNVSREPDGSIFRAEI
jgi:hypothetical protein